MFEIFCLCLVCGAGSMHAEIFANTAVADEARLLVLTDIVGDPDDQQSMVRLMLYANEFETEGLITSASGTLGEHYFCNRYNPRDESPRPTDRSEYVPGPFGSVGGRPFQAKKP